MKHHSAGGKGWRAGGLLSGLSQFRADSGAGRAPRWWERRGDGGAQWDAQGSTYPLVLCTHHMEHAGFEVTFLTLVCLSATSPRYRYTHFEPLQHLPATCSPWLIIPLSKRHPGQQAGVVPRLWFTPATFVPPFSKVPPAQSQEQLPLKATFFQ